MRLQTTLLTFLPFIASCQSNPAAVIQYSNVASIPAPAGYQRIETPREGFGSWLRKMKLKSDNTVYLYNGQPKKNQSAQFAVLDLHLGKRDLQQCADAIMRLRAEYLYDKKQYDDIVFYDNNRQAYRPSGLQPDEFEGYLETVFSRCGTISLAASLNAVRPTLPPKPGDVLIKGGSPGHAMIIVDVARNAAGNYVFMLAQSYMPAQNMHIVLNPAKSTKTPWYEFDPSQPIVTPEWVFSISQLKSWP
ncbi:MAG: hypothetical protein H7Y27_14140 [Gemmatimonadaceae bacterium]|nr:hypothetical protein [Chitinophagaceae bacterium]